jgi:hypothetical protein
LIRCRRSHLRGEAVQTVRGKMRIVGAVVVRIVRLTDIDDEVLRPADIQLREHPFKTVIELPD